MYMISLYLSPSSHVAEQKLPHKHDAREPRAASIADFWGPWSCDLHLRTCGPAIVILSLRYRGSLLGGQDRTASYRIIRHVVSQCASRWNQIRGYVFGQGCEGRPWVIGMRRSLCQESLVLTLADSKHHKRLLIHSHSRPGSADPSS
jgi:hypothetical protein